MFTVLLKEAIFWKSFYAYEVVNILEKSNNNMFSCLKDKLSIVFQMQLPRILCPLRVPNNYMATIKPYL